MTSAPSSWPGLTRPSTSFGSACREDVDGRAKPGHDVFLFVRPAS